MIQRVHLVVRDGAVRRDGIPALPDRRRAEIDLIDPARELLVEQEVIGQVKQPLLCQNGAQLRRTGKAALDLVKIELETPVQTFNDLIAIRIQIKFQCIDISSLGVAGKTSGLAEVLPEDRSLNLLRKRCVCCGILVIAQHLRRFRNNLRGPAVIQRSQIAVVGSALVAHRRRSVQCHPVTELEAEVPQIPASAVRRAGLSASRILPVDPVDPVLHHGISFSQFRLVSVCLIQRPRHEGSDIAPDGSAARRVAKIREEVRDGAVHHDLLVAKVLKELVEERQRVHVIGRRRCENVRVTGPAKALGALRAVGRNVDEVRALAPDRVLVQTVDLLVACLQISGAVQIRVQHTSAERGGIGLALPAGDLHIPEAEEREPRLHDLRRAVRDEMEFGFCIAVLAVIEVAVLHDLAELQLHMRAFRKLCLKLHKSGKILPEVEDGLAGRGVQNFLHRNAVLDHDRQRQTVAERHSEIGSAGILFRVLENAHRLPRILFSFIEQAVDDFAVVNARVLGQRAAHLPAFVGRDDLLAAVLIENVQLGCSGHAVTEVVGFQLQAEDAHVPAFAAGDGQAVFSFCEFLEHKRNDLKSLLIVIEIGSQILISHLLAVQRRLKQAGAADIEPGALDRLFNRKGLGEFRMERIFLRRCNPLAQEGLTHLARLEEAAAGRCLTVVRRHRNLHIISCPRLPLIIQHGSAAVRPFRAQQQAGKIRLIADFNDRFFAVLCLCLCHFPGNIDRIQRESDRLMNPVDLNLFNLHAVTPVK